MSQQPLVSVIVASYNHGAYIEDCLNSVLDQTYPSVELLVIDDGSSDDSVERIERLCQARPFDFIRQANQGLPRTLNAAIARSKGALIAPFGSDDIMLPERLAKQVAYMQGKPEVGICAGNVEVINSRGELAPKQRRAPADRMDFEKALMESPPFAPTLLFRREALATVGGFDPEIPLEDLLVALKIAQAGYYIDTIDDVLVRYRMHDTNTSKNKRFMVENVLRTYSEFSDHPLYEKARARYINSTLLKLARADKALYWSTLGRLPLSAWNSKTLRSLLRFGFSWGVGKGA
ncbi:glycosyltransferase [Pseudomonas sp. ABC1]|uniref:glycosyltransferase n=1 Tax=Pseudomonas sp. ABC1 TaxID=2748080 RepID=UPI0015C3A9D8|nr:glycosyltransferase [Pseudomonas sp. ABC1]QLF94154.1 glycosyltransferase [Pseudomonas sp. ABC1]